MGVPEECYPSPAASCLLLLPEESPADVWLSVGAEPRVCLLVRVSSPRACGTSLCSARCALPVGRQRAGGGGWMCEQHGPAVLKSSLSSGEAQRGKEWFRLRPAWKRGKSSGCSREALKW